MKVFIAVSLIALTQHKVIHYMQYHLEIYRIISFAENTLFYLLKFNSFQVRIHWGTLRKVEDSKPIC